MTVKTSSADVILNVMETYGVETMFSIPGIHTVEFYRTLEGRAIRHVTPRHEQGAAFMAYGYGFATGRPACVMLITGPGLLNAATGLAEAYSDSVPVLAIAANNLVSEIGVGRGALHETQDQTVIGAQVAGFTHVLLDPANTEEVMHRAMSHLTVARPRPVLIDVPRDILARPAPYENRPKINAAPPSPNATSLDEAAALLNTAENPLIIAGGGARHAAKDIRALAAAFNIPVVTTNSGKGILPEDHPLSLGSTLPFAPTQARVKAADVVLALGTELGETDLLYTCVAYEIPGKLIRVDIDPAQLTMNYHPAVTVLGDAGDAVRGLISRLDREPLKGTPDSVKATLDTAHDGWSKESAAHKAVLDVLAETLDADAIICADSTQIAYTGNHYFPSKAPGCWLFPNGYGTLGSAMPAALGAKLGCPNRQVLAIVGDGSFLYTIEELACAVENNIGVPILLWNNHAYGEIRDAMKADNIPTVGVDLYTPDFQTIAKGFGCKAVKIRDLDALAPALTEAFGADVPTLIEIDITEGGIGSIGG